MSVTKGQRIVFMSMFGRLVEAVVEEVDGNRVGCRDRADNTHGIYEEDILTPEKVSRKRG